jgi:hypothetical protein
MWSMGAKRADATSPSRAPGTPTSQALPTTLPGSGRPVALTINTPRRAARLAARVLAWGKPEVVTGFYSSLGEWTSSSPRSRGSGRVQVVGRRRCSTPTSPGSARSALRAPIVLWQATDFHLFDGDGWRSKREARAVCRPARKAAIRTGSGCKEALRSRRSRRRARPAVYARALTRRTPGPLAAGGRRARAAGGRHSGAAVRRRCTERRCDEQRRWQERR